MPLDKPEASDALDDPASLPARNSRRSWGFHTLVRPKLRPFGLLAISIAVSTLVTFSIKGILTATTSLDVGGALFQLSTGTVGQALALVLILRLAGEDFGLHDLATFRWRSTMLGLALGGALFGLELMLPGKGMLDLGKMGSFGAVCLPQVVLAVISGILLAISGALEEVLFRGLIHTSFARHYGPRLAVFLTAVLFAAPHLGFGWITPVELFLLGIVLSWYRQTYGRIDLPIAAHSFHNLLYCLSIAFKI